MKHLLLAAFLFGCASKQNIQLNNDLVSQYFRLIGEEKFDEAQKLISSYQNDDLEYLNASDEKDQTKNFIIETVVFPKQAFIDFTNVIKKSLIKNIGECRLEETSDLSIAESQFECWKDKKRYARFNEDITPFHYGNYLGIISTNHCERQYPSSSLSGKSVCLITGHHREIAKGIYVSNFDDIIKFFIDKRFQTAEINYKNLNSAKEQEVTSYENKKLAIHQEYESSTEFIRDEICNAKNYQKMIEKDLDFHKRAGQRSGFVNATELNQLGLRLESNDLYIKERLKEFRKRTDGKAPNLTKCFETRPKQE
jgi:hypothetical protein